MITKRKVAFLVLILGLLLSFVGCGGNNNNADSQKDVQGEVGKVVTVRYGHNYPIDSPAHKAAEAFKEKAEKVSEGTIQVEIYPAMQLGSNREQFEALQQGSIQVDLQPTAIAGNFIPEFQILDLPFVFPSEEVMWKVLDGDFGEGLLQKMEDKGIKGLGFTWTGFKQITANKPIAKFEDLKGLKMRVLSSPLLIEQYKGWGSNPTPIDFSELYTALQQNVVDGQENNFWTNAIQKYYEVQTDLAVTSHAPLPAVLMMNKAWFDKLQPLQQEAILEAGRIAVATDREELSKVEQQAIETMRSNNVTFHEISPEELDKFKAASQSVYDWAKKELGSDLYEQLIESVEANQ